MNRLNLPLFKNFLTQYRTEYLIIDQNLTILDLSTQASQLAETPDQVKPGQDIRLGFPEFIGAEACFQAVLDNCQAVFDLKYIARSPDSFGSTYASRYPFAYLNIHVTKHQDSEDDFFENKLFILLEDVTEKVNLEQSLLQITNETSLLLRQLTSAKNYIDCIMTSMADALLVTTPAGIIKTVNPATQILLGYSEAELLGQPISSIFPTQEEVLPAGFQSNLVQKSSLVQRRETTCLTRTGEQMAIELSYSTVIESEDFQGLIYSIRDIGDRQRAEQLLLERNAALEQARQVADQANFAKSSFLAMMSHEIRTPLNAVIGMTDLLLNQELTPKQRDYTETIRLSGDMLLTVINDILDFSKIESGKLELETQPFDLRNCIRDALSLLAPRASAKDLELVFMDKPTLPHVIAGDAIRLRQILVNLLNNAIKFTEVGEVIISIKARPLDRQSPAALTESYPASHEIQFAVKDTGIGIPGDRLDRLFQGFSQIDASITRRFGGTGLGLAISKKLCELMGGRIWVESQPGQGSVFYFTIKAQVLPETSLLPVQSAPALVNPNLGIEHPLRILLAEDHIINQRMALLMLEQLGYTAEVVSNGLEVLAALQHSSVPGYDVILMDVQMPELDGISATRQICRQIYPNGQTRPRIIAMTANAMESDRQICLEAGMDGYIIKPIRLEILAQALSQCCNVGNPQPQPESQSEILDGSLASPVDPTALQAIQDMFTPCHPSFITEMVHLYVETSEDMLKSMQESFGQRDAKTLRRLAHTLYASSATVGAMNVARLCRDLETIASKAMLEESTQEQWTAMAEYVARMKSECHQVQTYFQLKYPKS